MAKFKVGDWVRVIDNEGAPAAYTVGDVVQVSLVDGNYIQIKGKKAGMFDHRFEPWTPKVGERVRLVKDGRSTTGAVGKLATIEKLSDGTIVDEEEYLLNIDPPVDYKTVSVTPNYTRAKIDCFEPAGNEPALRLEAGKYYRTRDGRRVLVKSNNCAEYPFFHDCGGHGYHAVDAAGKSCIDSDKDDLIAEWHDEPAPTNVSAQVDAIADEYGPATTTQPAIVCLIENGQPKPATRPFVHANRGAASAEAARLANVNRGQEFGVYVLAESKRDEPPAARYKVGDVVKHLGARDTIKDSQFVGGRWQYSLKRARGIFYDNELYPAKFDHEWQELAANGQRGAAIRIIQDKTGLSVEHARLAVNAWADAA